MGYGTVSREQELENALRRLIDLYDENVIVLNHQALVTSAEAAELESALEAAAIAIELEDDNVFDLEEDDEGTPTF